MTRPTDKPMARAQAHLAAGRFPEAIGAFRAVLAIDASMLAARLGLADAFVARGQRSFAVDGLVEAAEQCTEHGRHEPALVLYGKAIELAPNRMELQLDMAMVEHAMDRQYAAIDRVEGLAERYMSMGRTDEAAELLRFAASWEEADEGEPTIEELEVEEATVVARNPLLPARTPRPAPQLHTETVVCATVLVRPDGSLWFANEASSGMARAVSAPIVLDELEIDEADPDMVTRVAAAKPVRTVQARPVTSQARPIVSGHQPAAPLARPVVSSARPPAPPARPPAPPARPVASPIRSAAPPVERVPARAGTGGASAANPMVDRLRKRAGLGPEVTAVPRSAQGRGTEPIVIRRPNLGRLEDEVTHRVRHPRAAQHAATH